MEKSIINFNPTIDFGDLFQKYVAPNSIEFNILMKTWPNLFTIRYEWEESIDFIVNPTDSKLKSYFTQSWDEEKILTMFERKTRLEQVSSFLKGCINVLSAFIKSRVKKI